MTITITIVTRRGRRDRHRRINKNTNLTQPNAKRATFVGRAHRRRRRRPPPPPPRCRRIIINNTVRSLSSVVFIFIGRVRNRTFGPLRRRCTRRISAVFLFCFRNSPTQIIKVVRDQRAISVRRRRSSCGGRDRCCRSRQACVFRRVVNPDRPARTTPRYLYAIHYIIVLRFSTEE